MSGSLTWRRVERPDFPLLQRWLGAPHVARWWCHDTSDEAVERDFGPAADGTEPGEDLLVHLDGVPVALVQRSRYDDYPEERDELAALVDVPAGAVQLDYLVGEEERTGRGLGTALLEAVVEDTWARYPDAPAVVIAVNADNRPSWRALERAGLRRVAQGDLEPDGPGLGRHHVVYRVDRPRAVLVTGMSGAGKTTALAALAARGHRVVDADDGQWVVLEDHGDGPEQVWDLTRVAALLDDHRDGPLFVAGTVRNQGALRARFSCVVLLTAPVDVLLARVADRENPYGSTEADRRTIAADVAAYEHLLRASADVVVDSTQPLERVVEELERAAATG